MLPKSTRGHNSRIRSDNNSKDEENRPHVNNLIDSLKMNANFKKIVLLHTKLHEISKI